MAVEIRPVRPQDQDEAGRVTAGAYEMFGPGGASPNPDYLDRVADVATRSKHGLVLGAFDAGAILGTVTLELVDRIPGGHPRPPLQPDQAHVRMLGVDARVRRRGIGRALMEACIVEARKTGKKRLTLETTASMTAAHHLYEAMGFRRDQDTVYDDGFRLRNYSLPL
ncbi:MAG: GNAT family N-acetyltransferase [Actinomycetota bacterium]